MLVQVKMLMLVSSSWRRMGTVRRSERQRLEMTRQECSARPLLVPGYKLLDLYCSCSA